MSSRTSNVGILAILFKIGPKLASIFAKIAAFVPKILKGALTLKTASVALSVGAYSLILSWQMAISLVAFILIHEYGHLLAMKKCGIATKGIYMIPFMGGVAVANEKFKSAKNEVFIAIAGPLMGLVFIIPVIVIFMITHRPIFAAIASTMALINLFNLFPINPLDGGRIMKGLLYSFRSSVGFSFSILSIFAAMVFGIVTNLHLLTIISLIGFMEVTTDYGLKEHMKELGATLLRIMGVMLIWLIIGASGGIAWKIFEIFYLAILITAFSYDIYRTTIKGKSAWRRVWTYPWVIIRDSFLSIYNIFTIDHKSLKVIDGYDGMDKKSVTLYSLAYLGVTILMISLIWLPSHIPGCEIAKEMLK